MSSRRTATLVAIAALAATIAAAPAQAQPKGKPNMKVTALSGDFDSLATDGRVDVRGDIQNLGKAAGKAVVRIVLRGNGAETEIASTSARVKAKAKKRFNASATVPSSLSGGSYELAACVPKRGTKGKARCSRVGSIQVTSGGTPPPPKDYTPGSRSLGDPLFPQTGNGGYDARSYDIELDYDPVLNDFESATTTMAATATQDLSRFSLDFQDLDVSSVTVNGAPATFTQELADPPLGDPADVTQLRKLTITPATPIDAGSSIVVEVDYSGTPVRLTDIDGSYEGWIPACYGPGQTPPCDGGFVVNEPNGAQAWFPNNNYPTDKATFDTTVTVPVTHTALGVGELTSRVDNGDGTWTWSWSEDTPMSTYLTTATVGLFNYSLTSMIETSTNRALPIYNAVDSSYAPPASTNLATSLEDTDEQLNYLSDLYGPYPLDSYGSVVDRTTGVGYALEVQTKSHYAQIGTTSQDINISTQLHETAHQWMGNTVTLERWTDIWFQEGCRELVGVDLGLRRERRRLARGDLRRPLRHHPGRGLGDRASSARRRPGEPVRVLPDLRAGCDDRSRRPARSSARPRSTPCSTGC